MEGNDRPNLPLAYPLPQPEADEGNLGGDVVQEKKRNVILPTYAMYISFRVMFQFLTIGLRSSPFDSRLSPLSLRTLKRFGQVVAR